MQLRAHPPLRRRRIRAVPAVRALSQPAGRSHSALTVPNSHQSGGVLFTVNMVTEALAANPPPTAFRLCRHDHTPEDEALRRESPTFRIARGPADSCGGVAVPVVTIGKVLMRMGYRLMGVGMAMPDASRSS